MKFDDIVQHSDSSREIKLNCADICKNCQERLQNLKMFPQVFVCVCPFCTVAAFWFKRSVLFRAMRSVFPCCSGPSKREIKEVVAAELEQVNTQLAKTREALDRAREERGTSATALNERTNEVKKLKEELVSAKVELELRNEEVKQLAYDANVLL